MSKERKIHYVGCACLISYLMSRFVFTGDKLTSFLFLSAAVVLYFVARSLAMKTDEEKDSSKEAS